MNNLEQATFGAGCFWGVEKILGDIPGVEDTMVGYAGGTAATSNYDDVCTGRTEHAEVVQLSFNPEIVSFSELLSYFFRLHDATTPNRQGADMGPQYRSSIFFHSEDQLTIAKEKIDTLNKTDKYKGTIVTTLERFHEFYLGEDYHQKYYDKKYQGGPGPICHFLRDDE